MSEHLDAYVYDITAVELISSTASPVNIKFMVHDLNIYESVFNNVVSGDMILWDSVNLLSEKSLHGNEYLMIRFSKNDLEPIEKYFRIYKISNVKMRNLTTMEYTIHFCSEEFVLNQQRRISKSYQNVTNDQIILDILQSYLGVQTEKIVGMDRTVITQNVIIPNMKPFEAINWLASFSLKSSSKTAFSSAFLFFENVKGFQFKSLSSLYETPSVKTLKIAAKNVIDEAQTDYTNFFIADKVEFPQYFDILKTIASGGYSSSMLAMNLLGREHAVIGYDSVVGNFDSLNEHIPYNDATNRFGQTVRDGTSYIRYFPTFQGALVDDWLLQKASQLAQLNNMQMTIQIPGDPQLTTGSVIEVDYPYIQPIDAPEKTEKDEIKSGRYLITGLRHRIIDSVYINYLELCKDSNLSKMPGSINSQKLELAKKS